MKIHARLYTCCKRLQEENPVASVFCCLITQLFIGLLVYFKKTVLL